MYSRSRGPMISRYVAVFFQQGPRASNYEHTTSFVLSGGMCCYFKTLTHTQVI